jgi:hypothetical protein
MSPAASIVLAVVLGTLGLAAFGPTVSERLSRRRRPGGNAAPRPLVAADPGRERRAERKARELMRSIVGSEDFAMYEQLGFLRVLGRDRDGRPSGYGYLIYPHRPIVAYDTGTYRLLSEYCIEFPDRLEPAHGERLPDADDALAKWMSLHGDERKLIADANMHLPGRQIDPDQLRRDLRRMREWERAQL